MNPRLTLLLFLLISICCRVTLGQEPTIEQADRTRSEISEDIKGVKYLQAEFSRALQHTDLPSESYVRTGAVSSRRLAFRLRKNLGLDMTAGSTEKQSALSSANLRNTIISLEKLLAELIKEPMLEPAANPNPGSTTNVAKRLNALIEFTDPGQLEYGREYPLQIGVLLDLLLTMEREKTNETTQPQLVKIVRKRCVDFIDNGTNFWALNTVGASESLMKEIDTCLSAESRAIILNRLAATPESELTVSKAAVFGDVIRSLYIKKDIANRKRFLEAGREFLRRFGDESCAVEMVDWLKATIPKVEAAIEKMAVSK